MSLAICEASPIFLDQPYQGYLDDAWFNFWNNFFFTLLGINLGELGTDYQGDSYSAMPFSNIAIGET